MKEHKFSFWGKLRKYHFQIKHLLVLLLVLIFFLMAVSYIQKSSLSDLLFKTQDWYQQDSAERLANLTATSLELLLETTGTAGPLSDEDARKIVQAFNIILSQQNLQQNVQEICILVSNGGKICAIDDGSVLYSYMFKNSLNLPPPVKSHDEAIKLYGNLRNTIMANEQIYSIHEGKQTFHVFVPFVPKGEYTGAVYVKNTPDFSVISREMILSYDKTALIFAGLIFLGLFTMFLISSRTLKERDETQKLLLAEQERHLTEKINYQKEQLFTKRIYHTHHKAEKVMGFIKEDLRNLSAEKIDDVKYRVTRYANFISRVIYDMKWYDPPLQTIRNPVFRTDLNEVIRFIVRNIFLRTSAADINYQFKLKLDPSLPAVNINEFVVWEIIEPILQNSIDHGGEKNVLITVQTAYDPEAKRSIISIANSGEPIREDLLKVNEAGVKRIFLENISTKNNDKHSGYGCYLAYEISRQRCGWQMDAENLPQGGCRFIITINH
ncbi:MAG: histidine kinase [Calditrichia bacterium]